jgi:tetratricopeptide (TPR) repeat protein
MSGLRSFSRAGTQPDRNAPCPCGSGLKYKKCCAILPRPAQAAQAQPALGTLTAIGREADGNAMINRALREGPLQPPAAPLAEEPVPTPAQPSAMAARLVGEARRLCAAGRVEESIPLYHEVVLLEPDNAALRQEFGSALLDSGRFPEAVDSLATAIRLDPNLAIAHFRLGLAFSRWGRVDEAIASYHAAIAVAPKLADAHFALGSLLLLRGQSGAAAEAFDRAAEAAASSSMRRLAAARALIARDRREEGIALLRRARVLDPTSKALLNLLAYTLMEVGRLAEAEQELAKALAVNPNATSAWYELTALRKMTPSDRPLIERMTEVLHGGGLSRNDRVLLHFALGKLHDDLREFEVAISHYDAANRIRAENRLLDRNATTRKVNRQIARFPAGTDLEDTTLGCDDERPVLIVGMPRSGTTLVEQILSSHPQVAAAGELLFWGDHEQRVLTDDEADLTAAVLQPLAARYQAVLRRISAEALRVTDKNPFNFMYLGLVRLAFPRAFIIHCRRHPLDTCLSIYRTYFTSPALWFMGNREELVFYYREYERLMRHWHEVLPPERFLAVDYEKLVSNREAETRRLISFCELEWDDACLQPERNARVISTASVWQARQPVYRSSVERWRNYEPWLGALAELRPAADSDGGSAPRARLSPIIPQEIASS